MKRSKKMVVLCHCILNSNSKVEGLSEYPAAVNDILDILKENNLGIIQLPCPEIHVYGINRWGHVKEQFDTYNFRNQCKGLLEPITWQLSDYIRNGYEIVGIIGVDGSPSCGVNKTCSGNWGGELSNNKNIDIMIKSVEMIEGKGVFIEELLKLFKEYDLEIPFRAIDEGNVMKSIKSIKDFIENK